MTTPAAVAGEIVSGEGSIINEARAAAQYGKPARSRNFRRQQGYADAKDEDGYSYCSGRRLMGAKFGRPFGRGADCNDVGGFWKKTPYNGPAGRGGAAAPCCSEKAAATRRTGARRAARPCTSVAATARSRS